MHCFSLQSRFFLGLLSAVLAAAPAHSNGCRIQTGVGKCISVPVAERSKSKFTVGDTFPVYEHNMIMNIEKYDLPPVSGGWRYYKEGYQIFRVDAKTAEILEIVNARSN